MSRFKLHISLIFIVFVAFSAYADYESDSFTIAQTLSDGAQRNTIAFDGLAFITGSLGANSFLPPGKMADFFGFQSMRDNAPEGIGHNTEFLDKVATNLLYALTPEQRDDLVALAYEQVDSIEGYALARFPLMKAFQRLLEGDIPAGSPGLDRDSVMAYSAGLFSLDGGIAYRRAEVYGSIIHELDADQRLYLDSLLGVPNVLSWPDVGEVIDHHSLPHDVHVAVMTYASDMFSWYGGSVEGDVYFCPERVATYFGSFYMKDAPAMASDTGYTIPMNLTDSLGKAFLRIIPSVDSAAVASLVDTQRADLYAMVDVRDSISRELRRFMAGEEADSLVIARLAQRYGELDGEISYWYATVFAAVASHLTPTELDSLFYYRDLEPYPEDSAYLYSEPVAMPEIINTDFLFVTSSVATEERLSIPDMMVISAHPNPFNSAVMITAPAGAEVEIFDLNGRNIAKFDGGTQVWKPEASVGSGIYLVRARAGDETVSKRIVYLK